MHLRHPAARILLCAALALLPRPLLAQEVQGRVTSAGAAVPGSLVELLDAPSPTPRRTAPERSA